MNKPRKTVEQIKNQFRQQVIADAEAYKRSIIKEIITDYNRLKLTNAEITLQQVQDKVLRGLKVSDSFKTQLTKDITETDKEVSSIWNNYFKKFTDKDITVNYEKIVAASKQSFNFSKLDATLNDTVKREFRLARGREFDFNSFVDTLKKKDIGDASAYTMANTSVAQFDNAYHSETAQQAGIEEFLYDGDTSANTREFCLEHIGNIYTLDELDSMDNGQDLPVLYSLGGYNCQHFLTAVIK